MQFHTSGLASKLYTACGLYFSDLFQFKIIHFCSAGLKKTKCIGEINEILIKRKNLRESKKQTTVRSYSTEQMEIGLESFLKVQLHTHAIF
jgi:hypothetical protein